MTARHIGHPMAREHGTTRYIFAARSWMTEVGVPGAEDDAGVDVKAHANDPEGRQPFGRDTATGEPMITRSDVKNSYAGAGRAKK